MPSNAKLKAAHEQLREVAKRLKRVRRPGWGKEASRLDVEAMGDGLRVHWLLNEDALFQPRRGTSIFSEIYSLLGSSPVAPWLSSLTMEGHQIAMNGTIPWEIEPIAYAKSRFSRLKVFRLDSAQTVEGEPCYAGSLDGRDYGDTSVASRLLDRMPMLEEIAIPEPPRDEAFFQGPPHPLRRLSVFDTDCESFVTRLANSRRFPHLEELRITESFRTDAMRRLPVSQYARLFQSDAFPALRSITLGQVDVSEKQIPLLRSTRIGRLLCQLKVKPVQPWCGRPILRAPRETMSDLRNLCGPPVPAIKFDRRWRSDTVVSLANSIDAANDFGAMPILADALQDAGCTNEHILSHCRGPGPHARGCWVVDLVLGKE